LWEIYTLISPLYLILPPTLLPYFIPFLNSHIFAFAILRQTATILPTKVIHLHI